MRQSRIFLLRMKGKITILLVKYLIPFEEHCYFHDIWYKCKHKKMTQRLVTDLANLNLDRNLKRRLFILSTEKIAISKIERNLQNKNITLEREQTCFASESLKPMNESNALNCRKLKRKNHSLLLHQKWSYEY